MTVRTLLQVTTCPIELRSGRRSLFAKISGTNVQNHLSEEVWMIRARGSVLEVFSNVPDYELDTDVDVDQTEDDLLPWY